MLYHPRCSTTYHALPPCSFARKSLVRSRHLNPSHLGGGRGRASHGVMLYQPQPCSTTHLAVPLTTLYSTTVCVYVYVCL
jgi:hypothetical protein